jgi:hypothetical protein
VGQSGQGKLQELTERNGIWSPATSAPLAVGDRVRLLDPPEGRELGYVLEVVRAGLYRIVLEFVGGFINDEARDVHSLIVSATGLTVFRWHLSAEERQRRFNEAHARAFPAVAGSFPKPK